MNNAIGFFSRQPTVQGEDKKQLAAASTEGHVAISSMSSNSGPSGYGLIFADRALKCSMVPLSSMSSSGCFSMSMRVFIPVSVCHSHLGLQLTNSLVACGIESYSDTRWAEIRPNIIESFRYQYHITRIATRIISWSRTNRYGQHSSSLRSLDTCSDYSG
jgi:hypothetical protein